MDCPVKLRDLLAPTWRERARAEDALLEFLILDASGGAEADPTAPWPPDIQRQIQALEPSPAIFLSALVAFWADVAERSYQQRMAGTRRAPTPRGPRGWSSPHLAAFPMAPASPTKTAAMMRGLWVWSFIARLGPWVSTIEDQLIACLEHPEPVVQNAAEAAFGTVDTMGDNAFARFLQVADRRLLQGQSPCRAQVIARHLTGERLTAILEGLEPSMPPGRCGVRFAILGELTGELAKRAHDYLRCHLHASWSPGQWAGFIGALGRVSRHRGFDPETVAAIEPLVGDGDRQVRCAAAVFLLSHSPTAHGDPLAALAASRDPLLLMKLCQGLAEHAHGPPGLLEAVVTASLGNYQAGDGEPHHSAVELLMALAQRADGVQRFIPAIRAWCEKLLTEPDIDGEDLAEVLDLVDALGSEALSLRGHLVALLARWTADAETETEVTLPSLEEPGAVAKIQAHLQQRLEAGGADGATALATAQGYGVLLQHLADNLAHLQREFDAQEAAFDAEQRELYPEAWSDTPLPPGDAASQWTCDGARGEDEDELAVRLRHTLARLGKGP
ncbi:MAG: hypothetical protein ACFCBW_21985 [Candidatus Competibacterales bacterium]